MEYSGGARNIKETRAYLRPVKGFDRAVRSAVGALARVPRGELSPAAEWLMDNARWLRQKNAAFRRALRGVKALPAREGTPEVQRLCGEIAAGAQTLRRADIADAVRAYQTEQRALTEKELCALPLALTRAYLAEALRACRLCALEARAFDAAKRLLPRARRGDFTRLPPDQGTARALRGMLRAAGEKKALAQLDAYLMRASRVDADSPDEALRALRHAILSLRALDRLRFSTLIEEASRVGALLNQDAVYARMDRESRAYYRALVARRAKKCRASEENTAQAALALAREGAGVRAHVGFYLLEAPAALYERLGRRAPLSEGVRERLFVGFFAVCFLLFLFLGVLLRLPWALTPAFALCLSELVRLPVFFVIRRACPARLLPRIQIRELPADLRTLVVVPTLLTDARHALKMVRRLSVLKSLCLNDVNVEFMLLGDLKDSATRMDAKDDAVIHAAREGVQALCDAHGDIFHVLIRERQFSKSERRYIARERKRGALTTLFQLMEGQPASDAFCLSTISPRALSNRYAYVVTLDADTCLKQGDVRKLVGAMEHPLQKGRVAVVQPAMRVMPTSVKTRAQRLLGGASGLPAYAGCAQDAYQDAFGRGSFVGKGIIDPKLFLKRAEGRIREERVLSHDLLEGELTGSASAGDLYFMDGHPKRLDGWYKRLNRWTRGDWQLIPYLFDRALSPLSRFKLLDNLRRSLVPPARVAILLYAGLTGAWIPALLALPWPVRGGLMRLLLLPGKAYAVLDAILRACYRMAVSKRGLLQWVTAQEAEEKGAHLFFATLFQTLAGGALLIGALLMDAPFPFPLLGACWAALPLFVPFLNAERGRARPLAARERETLRALARDVFGFFTEHVTARTHFLPPDNVQLEPDKGLALRTSPTNIGLYLLSLAAARALQMIDADTFARRALDTVRTLEKLPKYEGHLYNWYDLETLQPLAPLFVSSVDAGNLAACLLAVAQALRADMAGLDASLRELPERMDALFWGMRFSLLFDRADGLFSIGLNAETGEKSEGRYDLLASEALLLSYISVISGQAPAAHFKRLGRPLARVVGGAALVSWGGTMFEYLMPCLLLPLTRDTLLDATCRRVVRAQRLQNPLRPYGVSESGYYAFDTALNYQYRAFGLPALALSPDAEDAVVAPYASALSAFLCPRAAVKNVEWFQRLNAYGAFGPYEALDYSRRRASKPPAIVKSFMAHHQGMTLCAVANALTDGALTRTFMSLPAAEAYQYLLCDPRPKGGVFLPPPRVPERVGAPLEENTRALKRGAKDLSLLCGGKTVWATDGRGDGFIKSGDIYWTRYFAGARRSGPRLYVQNARGEWLRPSEGSAAFKAGSAVYRAALGSVRITETRFVNPMDGAAIALLEVENKGEADAEITLVSFAEPALGRLSDDLSHPNFRDLFVTVERVGKRAIAAKRVPRGEEERGGLLLHAFVGEADEIKLQGDRALFMGRGDGALPPKQLAGEAPARLGDTVMPCLSISARMTVKKAEKQAAAFILYACADEGACDQALHGYLSPRDAENALALAGTQGALINRALNMDADTLLCAERLLPRLLEPAVKERKTRPKRELWAHGVSGDRPILLALVPRDGGLSGTENLLKIHARWGYAGVLIDLVFLCAAREGYQSASEDGVRALIAESAAPRDAVFVLPRAEETEALFTANACVTVDLAHPLVFEEALAEPEGRLLPKLSPDLPLYENKNGFGGFSGARGYLVARPAPQPWCHFLCSERFCTLVCDTGILYSSLDNSRMKRLTARPLDVLNPENAEEILLLDASGAAFSPARGAALFEPGTAEYFGKSQRFTTSLLCFTDAALPVGARLLTLKNISDEPLQMTLCWRVHFSLGETPELTYVQNGPDFLCAKHPEFPGALYAALHGAKAGEDALRLTLAVPPHKSATAAMLLCFANDDAEMETLRAQMLKEGLNARLRLVRKGWDEALSRLNAYLSDADTERLMNVFLPYQTRVSRLLMRCGLYQAGGAYGFRDQLQDMLPLLYTEPERVREHLLLCAEHQYLEGDVQHWWHPPRAGVRTRITDDLLFLPYLTGLYARVTGDKEILSAAAPYLISPPLAPDERERYEVPDVSEDRAPLREHCLKAIRAVRFGAHGLPLMGGGDWNDGMNALAGDTGESVWLGFFLCVTLEAFAPYSGEEDELDALRRRVLRASDAAWTGAWYLRAWDKRGEPIGGPTSEVPRIDLISQCFAALAGVKRERACLALDAALDRLFDREKGILKLLDPPFLPKEDAGYIGAYLPGVRENGGQYTHAVPWMVLALLKMGRTEEAWEVFRAALPFNHADTPEKAEIYKVEPYVLSADIYTGENGGRGGWTWYTGSAAWMVYAFFVGLMGVHKRGEKLTFSPALPPDRARCTVIYRYQSATYELIADERTRRPTLDGERLTEGFIPLLDDGKRHVYQRGLAREDAP